MQEEQIFTVPNVATPEAVALALTNAVARLEGKIFVKGAPASADRKWLLDTYAECLAAVKNPGGRLDS